MTFFLDLVNLYIIGSLYDKKCRVERIREQKNDCIDMAKISMHRKLSKKSENVQCIFSYKLLQLWTHDRLNNRFEHQIVKFESIRIFGSKIWSYFEIYPSCLLNVEVSIHILMK